mmetsp:Transcript_14814/g.35306  ORF Transcript_14814/g.35306 Transcript_14814/m.35306 type:complete len:360 (+) Transcript_14814:3444-4523(+)
MAGQLQTLEANVAGTITVVLGQHTRTLNLSRLREEELHFWSAAPDGGPGGAIVGEAFIAHVILLRLGARVARELEGGVLVVVKHPHLLLELLGLDHLVVLVCRRGGGGGALVVSVVAAAPVAVSAPAAAQDALDGHAGKDLSRTDVDAVIALGIVEQLYLCDSDGVPVFGLEPPAVTRECFLSIGFAQVGEFIGAWPVPEGAVGTVQPHAVGAALGGAVVVGTLAVAAFGQVVGLVVVVAVDGPVEGPHVLGGRHVGVGPLEAPLLGTVVETDPAGAVIVGRCAVEAEKLENLVVENAADGGEVASFLLALLFGLLPAQRRGELGKTPPPEPDETLRARRRGEGRCAADERCDSQQPCQ